MDLLPTCYNRSAASVRLRTMGASVASVQSMAQDVPRIDPERRARVDQARQAWIGKLIDLSRRNNLLFFRELSTGTLRLSSAEAVGALATGEALGIRRLVAEERPEDAARTDAKVQEIRRRAVANIEERGVETLFVALGMASFPAADEGRPYAAPVFLLPVAIESRGRAGRPVLRSSGDLLVNEVLLHVLKVNHGVALAADNIVKLATADEQSGRAELGAAYRRVETAAAGVQGFHIDDQSCFLGNFSFQRLATVKDLQRSGDALAEHDIVAALAGDLGARRALIAPGGHDTDPRELDQVNPKQEHSVLDADSSQQAVIRNVLFDRDGVIEGPPGTGKSQTIANLIVEMAAQGKKVLFVAEKRAALEVVLRRLEAVDLGYLALDLHGAEIDRRKVLARVKATLDRVRGAYPVDAESLHGRFVERRARLHAHLVRLHTPRAPSNASAYELQGRLLRLVGPKSTVRWRGPDLDRLDAAAADAIRDLLVEAAGRADLFLQTNVSPWTGANLPDGAAVQQATDRARRLALELEPALARAVQVATRDLDLRPPENLTEAAAFVRILEGVATTLGAYHGEIFQQDLDALAITLAPARSASKAAWAWCVSREYRRARSLLRRLRRDPRSSTRLLLAETTVAREQRKRWRALSRPDAVPVTPSALPRLRACLDEVLGEARELGALLRSELRDLEILPFGNLRDLLSALADDAVTPHVLPKVIDIERGLELSGARLLVSEIRSHRPDPSCWPTLFEHAWLASCLDRARAEEPELAGFSGRTHETFVEEFKALDRQRLELAAARVRRAHGERAIAVMNQHPDEEDVIRSEAEKKTRHLPLRRLVERAAHVLTALQPCWMASPLSVSQLLPTGLALFDVVLFDEASQVPPEDAVCSIARGRHTVVAGDRRQLPPTAFFAQGGDGEPEAEGSGVPEGYESILDLMGAFLPRWPLQWHYRSRDESLIAFSNRHVYNDTMVTFPGPGGDPAISHALVAQNLGADGQEESVSTEVSRVVDLVLRHADERPQETLGVIAMGITHANRVQAALDLAHHDRPDLDVFFDQNKNERFFVKNLERVQGDERDAIILTIGYGKDRTGRLPYRFGPLLQDGGERRLNVAVTRARRRLTLVSSFSHLDMDPGRTKARGVELLRLYVEYAASGGTRLGETAGTGVPLNPFEQDVYETLMASGIHLSPQWGASRYRIDFVAHHPREPGRFVLAIECDGASYHAVPTVRDRDRLRQQHLEALGWRFHRIWSTDWFTRRGEEVARTLAAFKEAVARADARGAFAPPSSTPGPTVRAHVAPGRGPRPILVGRETIDDYSPQELSAVARWIMQDGQLRTDDQLVEEMKTELGFKRRGERIEAAFRNAIAGVKGSLGHVPPGRPGRH